MPSSGSPEDGGTTRKGDPWLRACRALAHAFGASYRGRSLCAYGEVATLSFHATKLFHTVEGGAVVTDDDEIARRVAFLRNFGHDGYERFTIGHDVSARDWQKGDLQWWRAKGSDTFAPLRVAQRFCRLRRDRDFNHHGIGHLASHSVLLDHI
jgi:hypothetical protein